MPLTQTLEIATLRGPSAFEMVKMMDDACESGGPCFRVFDEPSELLGEMLKGIPDFAALPASSVDVLRSGGAPYCTVAVMIRGGLFVCGTDERITALSDLEGKTVSVLGGVTPPRTMLETLLSEAGLDPKRDVKFDDSHPTHAGLADAAAKGVTQLCILAEPFVSMVLAANERMHVLLDLAGEWRRFKGDLPAVTVLACREPIVRSNPLIVKQVVSSLKQSCEWVKANPSEAARLVCGMGIFDDKEALAASVSRSGFDLVDLMV